MFHAPCAILCPKKGIFYCRPVFVNTANRHQDFLVWIKMGFAQGAGSSCDRRQSIASATLPPLGQTPHPWANISFRFACRRLLCSASRTSRDTPQSSVLRLYMPPVPTSITRRLHAYGIGRTGSLSKGRIDCLPAVKANPCLINREFIFLLVTTGINLRTM